VLNGLPDTPAELVDVGFVWCADDKSLSSKMPEKLRNIVGNPFGKEEVEDVW
jgi:hypothetical protein